MNNKEIALTFGTALDNDDYAKAKTVVAPDCTYDIGSAVLKGPDQIIDSYEENMKKGKIKFDKLVWGKCKIVPVDDQKFEVHFSDHLTKNGKTHNYKCKQILTINEDGLIANIEHQEFPGEKEKLHSFYNSVDIPY